jgi:hypothetical protein
LAFKARPQFIDCRTSMRSQVNEEREFDTLFSLLFSEVDTTRDETTAPLT